MAGPAVAVETGVPSLHILRRPLIRHGGNLPGGAARCPEPMARQVKVTQVTRSAPVRDGIEAELAYAGCRWAVMEETILVGDRMEPHGMLLEMFLPPPWLAWR